MAASVALIWLLCLVPGQASGKTFLRKKRGLPIEPFGHRSEASSEPVFHVLDLRKLELVEGPCLCPEGQFWDVRKGLCFKKYGKGIGCGALPADYKRHVCKDGLECRAEGGANASCVPCETKQACNSSAMPCLKEVTLKGEACADIEASMPLKNVSLAAVSLLEASPPEAPKKSNDTSRIAATASATSKVCILSSSVKPKDGKWDRQSAVEVAAGLLQKAVEKAALQAVDRARLRATKAVEATNATGSEKEAGLLASEPVALSANVYSRKKAQDWARRALAALPSL